VTSERPAWDEKPAEAMVGKRFLIGVTHTSPEGDQHQQMFGTIDSVDAARGIKFILEGSRQGEAYWLPPHLDAFRPAPPGEYRLKATGEVVVDPDYTTTWSFARPLN
jgi:hypothetical protein